jgi:hypothetical protein
VVRCSAVQCSAMQVLLDMEEFEYSYFLRGSRGFRVAFSSPLVRPVVRQQGQCQLNTDATLTKLCHMLIGPIP